MELYIKRIIDTQISPEGARPCFARFDERMKANEYAMEYGLTLDAHAPHFLDVSRDYFDIIVGDRARRASAGRFNGGTQ